MEASLSMHGKDEEDGTCRWKQKLQHFFLHVKLLGLFTSTKQCLEVTIALSGLALGKYLWKNANTFESKKFFEMQIVFGELQF